MLGLLCVLPEANGRDAEDLRAADRTARRIEKAPIDVAMKAWWWLLLKG